MTSGPFSAFTRGLATSKTNSGNAVEAEDVEDVVDMVGLERGVMGVIGVTGAIGDMGVIGELEEVIGVDVFVVFALASSFVVLAKRRENENNCVILGAYTRFKMP